jgi:hypothetical protein
MLHVMEISDLSFRISDAGNPRDHAYSGRHHVIGNTSYCDISYKTNEQKIRSLMRPNSGT